MPNKKGSGDVKIDIKTDDRKNDRKVQNYGCMIVTGETTGEVQNARKCIRKVCRGTRNSLQSCQLCRQASGVWLTSR